jgi:hypothetical protein
MENRPFIAKMKGEQALAIKISDRITSSRSEQFVGRANELAIFGRMVSGEDKSACLLHVFGPAGVGKTTLLREFQRRCGDAPTFWMDGRDMTPTTEAVRELHERSADARVLFIDEFDALSPLDGWFREVFFPSLPSEAIIVLAGRRPLSERWVSDPAWRSLARLLPLRNLEERAQRQLLALNNVALESQDGVMQLTRGHPLALALVVANLSQNRNLKFDLGAFPDVIRILLDRFIDNVPSAVHRQALEASSLIRFTTEGMLASLIDSAQPHDLFAWLRSLSFMESGPRGVYPNDLAREAIALELEWRNPDWHAQLHERARSYYAEHLERTRGEANLALVGDYIYLHRDNPAVKPFFDWSFAAEAYCDAFSPDDRLELTEMAALHEGTESANILNFWLDRQPQNVVVLRSSNEGAPIRGFLVKVEIDGSSGQDLGGDPGAMAAKKYLDERCPLRKGEVAVLFRFWMDRSVYQAVSASQSILFTAIVQCSLTHPNLAHTFLYCADDQFWSPMFSYAALVKLPQSDFRVGAVTYRMFGHDWRVLTPRAWLDLLSEQETTRSAAASERPKLQDVVLLSRESFNAAVADALKHFNNGTKLGANPLLRSRVVTRNLAAEASAPERAAILRNLICAEAESWQISGRDAKLYDALERGYIKPAPTQERAAELLDISIATFRRHLKNSASRLCDGLWELEIKNAGFNS